MNKTNTIKELEKISNEIRIKILEMLKESKSGHPGGSLSIVDILTVLYFYKMKHDPLNPLWKNRDRLILSKGHAAPALYATLAKAGYIPEEQLMTLRKIGSPLQGHPDMRKVKGIEMTTGSLGIGLSVGVGKALALKLRKIDSNVYVILGDGELEEGQVWEALLTANKYRLNNLKIIIDRNFIQLDGATEEILPLEPLIMKLQSFNMHVIEIDGNNISSIVGALDSIDYTRRPAVIIAHTMKGKGVDIMEWSSKYHGSIPPDDYIDKAINYLKTKIEE